MYAVTTKYEVINVTYEISSGEKIAILSIIVFFETSDACPSEYIVLGAPRLILN
jgi:hypothetical protein|tara:strand:+ start:80 stop:241 length:162 start_codon:yes stop_codon:yes gene_type:complete